MAMSVHSTSESYQLPESCQLPAESQLAKSQLPELPESCRAPHHPILNSVFKILCIIAVSRTSLDHWRDTKNKEWEQHVSMMTNRFQNSNITAGLVIATTTLFLSSQPPVEHLMPYTNSVSYIFAMISFGVALLGVISRASVLVIYETCTTHQDMDTLKYMSRHQVLALLIWLAYPSICLSVATCFLFMSIFIACFWSDNRIVSIITISGCVAFLLNGALTLYVFGVIAGQKSIDDRKTACARAESVTSAGRHSFRSRNIQRAVDGPTNA
ncbi:hypothetical protein EDB19DRAFT_2040882 [Suillus lakei]|nr:hypothetical protein EDB19DRAFT_2040882 [Suillus lakei]